MPRLQRLQSQAASQHESTPAPQAHPRAVPPRKGEEHVLSLLSLHQAAFGLGGCEAARVWGASRMRQLVVVSLSQQLKSILS